MTKDEIIKTLRDMAKYPAVTLPRDCEALKAAADLLAQQEAKDEPVGEVLNERGEVDYISYVPPVGTALYTTPPQRNPLSDDEIVLIIADCAASHQHLDIHLARAIEQAHGIK